MKLAIVVAAGVLATGIAFGASVEIEVEKKTYYVDTGTVGGHCRTRDVADGSRETVCRDGTNEAALSSAAGCLDSAGSGYCAVGRRRVHPAEAGSELTCASGAAYFLLVGPDATCRLSGESKTCTAGDGSQATADCIDGCGNTKGAGGCCPAGTTGCPPSAKSK